MVDGLLVSCLVHCIKVTARVQMHHFHFRFEMEELES